MTLPRVSTAVISALSISTMCLAAPSSASGATVHDACPSAAAELTTEIVTEGLDVVSCDLIGEPLTSDLGAVVEIPDVGEGVTLSASLVDGSLTLSVDTSEEGKIAIEEVFDGSTRGPADDMPDEGDTDRVTVDVDGCDNNSYGVTAANRVGVTYRYRFGDGPRPAGLSSAATLDIIFASFQTWGAGRNNCQIDDAADINYYYAGTSTLEANVSTTSVGCTSRDNTSVIDFGNLDDRIVGLHCGWRNSSDRFTESDIRLNTADATWTTTPRASSCNNEKFDIQSTMTHEIGHAYGLADLSSDAAYYQTMYGTSIPCKRFARTLARGDMRGINAIY